MIDQKDDPRDKPRVDSLPWFFRSFNPFDTPHKAKIGAKLAKVTVDVLISNHYHVVTSWEPVQPPIFGCYTLGLPSNLSSVQQLPPGGC